MISAFFLLARAMSVAALDASELLNVIDMAAAMTFGFWLGLRSSFIPLNVWGIHRGWDQTSFG